MSPSCRPGRPPLHPAIRRSRRLSIFLRPRESEMLARAAAAAGLGEQDWVRWILFGTPVDAPGSYPTPAAHATT